MGTNEKHPSVRRHQQYRKWLIRTCRRKKIRHHSRKWWKAWYKTWVWNATHHKVTDTEFVLPDDSWDEVTKQLKAGEQE